MRSALRDLKHRVYGLVHSIEKDRDKRDANALKGNSALPLGSNRGLTPRTPSGFKAGMPTRPRSTYKLAANTSSASMPIFASKLVQAQSR